MAQQIAGNSTEPQIVQLIEEQQNAGLLGLSYPVWTIIVAILLMIVAVKLSKSKKKPKNIIAIVGERFAGKTQLFININQGKKMRTVPSIHNNKTPFKLGNKNYEMIDYIGDNISKQQILQRIDEVNLVIHVIDGSDEKTISDASMFIYKMLVSKDYQKNNCNYIIFLNKNDLPTYIGKTKIEQKLEDEIEHIKQSRINLGEENQNEDDYIKLSKTRFKIPFQIVEGSAETNIKELQIALDSL